MQRPVPPRPAFLKKKYVVPQEHGSWTWWLGPFVIGLSVGGHPGGGVLALFLAALAGFLLHQPSAVAVRAWVGRYPRSDLAPALRWVALLSLAAGLAVPCLLLQHHARVLLFVAPGLVLFAWHLALVARRAERRRASLAVIVSGALALAAPAAYVVARGEDPRTPWALAVLCWLHNVTAIAAVYLRLDQRTWPRVPAWGARWRAAGALLFSHAAALAAAATAALLTLAGPWLPLAFLPPAVDALALALAPAPGLSPRRVGLRQLAVDVLFTVLVVLLWR